MPFGVNTYEIRPEEEGGGIDTQAGSHPDQLTTTLMLNETYETNPLRAEPAGGLAKDLHFKLPVGLIGNPQATPRCSINTFLSTRSGCYAAQTARVIVSIPAIGIGQVASFPTLLYNLEPAVGEPARFGFLLYGVPVILDTAVRTGEDYGVTVAA